MLKKLMYLMMASTAMLFATSCEKDVEVTPTSVVTFNVGSPELVSRAYSDGMTATVLQYAVYDETGAELTALTKKDATINGSTTVNLQLTTGNTYSVIFWAAAPNAPYTVDFATKTMTVDYSAAVSNDENRDAFYKYHTFTVNGAQTETIELKRPFAQLNIGTSDYAESANAGYTPAYSYVKVPVSSELNLVDGTVNEAEVVEYKLAAVPQGEKFPVVGYDYLSMNYMLVAADKELIEVEFGYSETEDMAVAKTRKIGSVPVQRNHRTNIYGQLFTSDVNINVEINSEYDQPDYTVDALQIAAAIGGTFNLTEDVTLPSLDITADVFNLNIEEGTTLTSGSATDYGLRVFNGVTTIDGDGTIASKGGGIGIIDGASVIFNNGNLDINTTSTSGRYLFYLEGAGSTLTINGGNFDFNKTQNQKRAYIYAGAGTTAYVKGGTFGKASTRSGYTAGILGEGTVIITGGTFGFDPTAWVPATHKVIVKDGKYIVVSADVDALITTSDELVDAFKNGGKVTLVDDVDLSEVLYITDDVEVVLDLNGKTITVSDVNVDPAIYMKSTRSTLTIEGNGTIELEQPSQSLIVPYGEVIINGGNFIKKRVPDGVDGAAMFVGMKDAQTSVVINGGYFDSGYYDKNADLEFSETEADIANRGKPSDKNLYRTAIKKNITYAFNLSQNSFKIYGGTFVGANPAWGDEGTMMPITPKYLRPWSYYQGGFLEGQVQYDDKIVIPAGYTITEDKTDDGRPRFTVTYSK